MKRKFQHTGSKRFVKEIALPKKLIGEAFDRVQIVEKSE
ncbi:hypothetical protein C240_1750 [Enterococcus sp. 5H]|nr:hypothetical protein [Enterococcus sp. 5H]